MTGGAAAALGIWHVAWIVVFTWGVVRACGWIRSRSAAAAAIVAVALLVRVVLGLTLFAISWFAWPIARGLQIGGGFWLIASDAAAYYEWAATAAGAYRLIPLDHALPSPVYIDLLAGWMMLVGIAPPVALFLNLLLYVAIAAMLVAGFSPVDNWRRDLPLLVALVSYSFSPVVLFHATQALKDETFNAAIALSCIGMLMFTTPPDRAGHPGASRKFAGAAAIVGSVFVAGGMRWYFAVIIIIGVVLTLAVDALLRRPQRRSRHIAATAGLLAACVVAFWASSGPYFWFIAPDAARVMLLPTRLATLASNARIGFLRSGGGTNVVIPVAPGESSLPRDSAAALESSTPVERAIPTTVWQQIKATAIGLGVIFVPSSLLALLVDLSVRGGRGLLRLVDLDTVFLDAAVIATLVLVWRRRAAIGNRLPFVLFTGMMATATAMLLGYVVTNLGTLFRMRVLVAMPLWMMVMAVGDRRRETAAAHADRTVVAAQRGAVDDDRVDMSPARPARRPSA